MRKSVLRAVAALVAAFGLSAADAASLMITPSNASVSSGDYAYGGSEMSAFSGHLDGSFDTIQAGDLTDLNTMLNYDAIWVTTRDQDESLTTTEASNLSAYISTGRKVLLQGELHVWYTWNQSILTLVDATVWSNLSGSGTTSARSPDHPLLNGVVSVYVPTGGLVSQSDSAEYLFQMTFAAVWGDNVLGVLDTNIFTDNFQARDDNGRFTENIAAWLGATPVPIPSAFWLFGSGIGLLAWMRRKIA